MLILTIRTDKPDAELGLYDDDTQLDYISWTAHRELAETIQQRIDQLLQKNGKELSDLRGIVAFQGPGSFTGLRIGLTVANALAYGLHIPIIATSSEDWIKLGLLAVKAGKDQHIVLPEYGAAPHITQQKK